MVVFLAPAPAAAGLARSGGQLGGHQGAATGSVPTGSATSACRRPGCWPAARPASRRSRQATRRRPVRQPLRAGSAPRSHPGWGAAGYPSAQGTPAGHPSPQAAPAVIRHRQGSPDRRPPTAGALPGGTPRRTNRFPGRSRVGRRIRHRNRFNRRAMDPPHHRSPAPGAPGPPSVQVRPVQVSPAQVSPVRVSPARVSRTGQAGPAQPGSAGLFRSRPDQARNRARCWLRPGRRSRPSSATSWRAVLDDGREIAIDGLVLLGRNPQARPGEEHATLIKVADTTRTVSKSHLEISLDPRGLHVVDRGSTNGSTVTSVSGVTRRCAPGEPIAGRAGQHRVLRRPLARGPTGLSRQS